MADSDQAPESDDLTIEFVRLLNRHERRLTAYVIALVPNWADADEIVQEARVRLWQQLDQYQRDRDFGAWACTIAHYLVLEYRTRVGRQRARFSTAFAEAVAEEFAAMPDTDPGPWKRALVHCLERLTPRTREIVRRYYDGEMTVEQLAAEQQRTSSAIYKTISSGRTTLHECIERFVREEHQ